MQTQYLLLLSFKHTSTKIVGGIINVGIYLLFGVVKRLRIKILMKKINRKHENKFIRKCKTLSKQNNLRI